MNQYLTQEFGKAYKTIISPDKVIQICVSEERSKINPFGTSFPIIISESRKQITISAKTYEMALKATKTILKDGIYNLDKLKNEFSDENLKLLKVNRYLSDRDIKRSESKIIYFPTISKNEIEELSMKCSVSKEALIKLNTDGKIFLSKLDSEIAGYGLITREMEDFVEISIGVVKNKRRQGIGFEMAKEMILEIYKKGMQVVYVTETENIASNRIAEKCKLPLFATESIGYLKHS